MIAALARALQLDKDATAHLHSLAHLAMDRRQPGTGHIAAPIVGGMITSTVHVLILVPVFFALMKERALKHGTLKASHEREKEED